MPLVAVHRPARAQVEALSAPDHLNVGAWAQLGWLGAILFIFGMTDIALGWYPAAFGNAEWEFGMLAATLNGLALPTIGLYFILCHALQAGRRRSLRALGVLCLLLSVGLLGLAFTYLTVVPLALSSASRNAIALLGLKKATAKAVVLLLGYLALYITATRRALRGASEIGPSAKSLR